MMMTSIGRQPNMREVGVNKIRSQMSEGLEPPPPSPSPFIWELGEVFIIFFWWTCIYKRAYRSYKWALNTT